jgi:GcrA cell cycle regulator
MSFGSAISWWTHELIELLKAHRLQGWSAGTIANALGTTRNAVIGKMHRLGLSRPSGIRIIRTNAGLSEDQRSRRIRKPSKSTPRRRRVIHTDIKPLRVALLDLNPYQCRFPLDEQDGDGRLLFCGCRVVRKKSWCPGHYNVVFDRRRTNESKDRAALTSNRRVD